MKEIVDKHPRLLTGSFHDKEKELYRRMLTWYGRNIEQLEGTENLPQTKHDSKDRDNTDPPNYDDVLMINQNFEMQTLVLAPVHQ